MRPRTLRRRPETQASPYRAGLLALFLLLPLVDLVGHGHAAGKRHAAVECALDHGADDPPRSAGPDLEAAGEHHQHRCVACRYNLQLGGLEAPAAVAGTAPDPADAGSPSSYPRAVRLAAGVSLRGPPAT